MLKLEKTNRAGISVRFRNKEPFFHRSLLNALGIALLFHAGMVLLFSIAPFYQDPTYTFPPIQVYLEQPPSHVASLAADLDLKIHFLPSYDSNELALSKELLHLQFFPYANIEQNLPRLDLLNALEEQNWPLWKPPLPKELSLSRLELAFSGEIIAPPSYSIENYTEELHSLFVESMTIHYHVKVESSKGKIFWFEPSQPLKKEIAYFFEKILKELQFEVKEESLLILNGQVQFKIFKFLESI